MNLAASRPSSSSATKRNLRWRSEPLEGYSTRTFSAGVFKTPKFQTNDLKHDEPIATNSIVLHDIHFDGPDKDGNGLTGALASAPERGFSSVARRHAEFLAMGKTLGNRSRWVLPTWFARQSRLLSL